MILEKLISGITTNHIIGETSIEITGINIDSRSIEKGHIFIAVRGTQTDGHSFIEKAIERGATAIACETIPNHPTLTLSHRVQKTILYIYVSFAISHTGLSLPSF